MDVSIILGVYTPLGNDACRRVNCFGGVDPPRFLTHGDASMILGVYTPQIIDAWGVPIIFGV